MTGELDPEAIVWDALPDQQQLTIDALRTKANVARKVWTAHVVVCDQCMNQPGDTCPTEDGLTSAANAAYLEFQDAHHAKYGGPYPQLW